MISIDSEPGVVTISMQNLSFGLVNYAGGSNTSGLLSPQSQTMQNLFPNTQDMYVFFNPAFRGLGLPHYAWASFSNLMEVSTKGNFDCNTYN